MELPEDTPMQLAVGASLGPYCIERKLGQGGMAEVYSARDTRLGRTVAIKLLRREFAGQVDFRHRFEREARAISALNHPHICSLYDVGEQDGMSYLVMEHVDGETLAQILTKGPLPVERALQYAIEITDALRTAHAHGIIHRDLKPGNIMIAGAGVKVLDFGLAKLSEHAAPADAETLTKTAGTRAGQILGTVAYMSPEQAEGKPLDARSDVFSLGIVLYEMMCAQRPFRGETRISTLAAILRETPETPSRVRTGIPHDLEQIVLRCLQKQPEARYGSADDLHTALESCRQSLSVRTGNVPWRRPAVIAAVLAVALAAGALGVRWFVRASRARWAQQVAVPEISRLMAQSHPLAAIRLLRQAEPYAASTPELIQLREHLALSSVSIATTPAGADIYVAEYAAPETGGPSGWEFLGQSPLTTSRIPFGYYRFRVVKKGFEPIEKASGIGANLNFPLHTSEETPGGMVWVAGAQKTARSATTFPALAAADIPAFWIDRYEVTNRQFKGFVDRGGYRNREYWKQPFLKDGRTLSWEQAMSEFRDATGKPGPASWELGTYPDGRADYPVGGVSWYEAAAYAEFAGKSLPTVYHWYLAASVGAYSDVLNLSNFGGQGPARVGSYRGLGEYGTYDMAGNVKEWCWNLAGDRRYILGGGWNEPSYQYKTPDARRPFDRDPTFGLRCIQPVSPPGESLAGIVSFVSRDRRNDKPADDQVFRIFQGLHSYDKTDLKPTVEAHDESPSYWRTEDITFQAAYGNERMLAHLYLPKDAAPPYQAVVFFGGVNFLTDQRIGAKSRLFDFVVRSGRAVIVPAYKGTLERGPGDYYHLLGEPNRWREMNLQQSKDLGRTIDYIETRPDIDARKLAFYGNSYGAAMAPHLVAVEPRIRCVVMMSGGSFEKVPAEVDSWNFAPRVKAPVLMVNGRDDFRFPLETSQLPLFRLLGTPAKDKQHVVREGGHLNPAGRPDIIKEILDWLDRYLGPVQTK
ncbi:MAG TPA: protein kinase [Bryobacteraceae bacterium]|nr:protein kinase [Bryobacteraceae bacterium]